MEEKFSLFQKKQQRRQDEETSPGVNRAKTSEIDADSRPKEDIFQKLKQPQKFKRNFSSPASTFSSPPPSSSSSSTSSTKTSKSSKSSKMKSSKSSSSKTSPIPSPTTSPGASRMFQLSISTPEPGNNTTSTINKPTDLNTDTPLIPENNRKPTLEKVSPSPSPRLEKVSPSPSPSPRLEKPVPPPRVTPNPNPKPEQNTFVFKKQTSAPLPDSTPVNSHSVNQKPRQLLAYRAVSGDIENDIHERVTYSSSSEEEGEDDDYLSEEEEDEESPPTKRDKNRNETGKKGILKTAKHFKPRPLRSGLKVTFNVPFNEREEQKTNLAKQFASNVAVFSKETISYDDSDEISESSDDDDSNTNKKETTPPTAKFGRTLPTISPIIKKTGGEDDEDDEDSEVLRQLLKKFNGKDQGMKGTISGNFLKKRP